jgi:hypothetical protein
MIEYIQAHPEFAIGAAAAALAGVGWIIRRTKTKRDDRLWNRYVVPNRDRVLAAVRKWLAK